MPQTADQLKTAELDKREGFLNALQEQLKKDGAHLHEQAKSSVAADRAKLDQREAAFAPTEIKLKEREGIVSARESSVKYREDTVTSTEAQQRTTGKQQSDALVEIAKRLHAVKEREEQHVRLRVADLAVLDQKRQVLNQDLEVRERHLAESKSAQETRQTALAHEEAALAGKRKQADELLRTAEARAKASKDGEQELKATWIGREAQLTEREAQVSKREADTKAQRKAASAQAEANEIESARLLQLQKGLEKAKADIEIKAARTDRLSRIVKTVIEQKKVKEALSAMVSDDEVNAFLNG